MEYETTDAPLVNDDHAHEAGQNRAGRAVLTFVNGSIEDMHNARDKARDVSRLVTVGKITGQSHDRETHGVTLVDGVPVRVTIRTDNTFKVTQPLITER